MRIPLLFKTFSASDSAAKNFPDAIDNFSSEVRAYLKEKLSGRPEVINFSILRKNMAMLFFALIFLLKN